MCVYVLHVCGSIFCVYQMHICAYRAYVYVFFTSKIASRKICTTYRQYRHCAHHMHNIHTKYTQMYSHIHTNTCSLHKGFTECMCLYCMYRVCMYFPCICVCYGMYVYVSYECACMMHVLYVLAQASTDDVTTSPKHPSLGQHPTGPTQGTPGQLSPFFPPSGTQPRTRFRALTRAARVGGGPKRALCAARGPPASTWHSASPPRAPSEMIWVGGY